MTKVIFLVAVIFAGVFLTKGQDPVSPSTPTYGGSPAQFYQDFVLQSAASKIMAVPLPDDLQLKLNDVLAASRLGFSACDLVTVTPPMIFNKKSKKCAIKQFKTVIMQLAAIEQEAILRNATSTTTTTTTTTTTAVPISVTEVEEDNSP